MTTAEPHFRAWVDQAFRPVIREILRDELADILPTLRQISPESVEERPINVKAAAKFLGIAQQTVYQNIDKIPHDKRHGRLYFYESKLRTYISGEEAA